MIGWLELLIGFLIGLFGNWLTHLWSYKQTVAPTVDKIADATDLIIQAVDAAKYNRPADGCPGCLKASNNKLSLIEYKGVDELVRYQRDHVIQANIQLWRAWEKWVSTVRSKQGG